MIALANQATALKMQKFSIPTLWVERTRERGKVKGSLAYESVTFLSMGVHIV